MKILVNHIGYELNAPKKALLNSAELELTPDFQAFHAETGQLLASGTACSAGRIPHWDKGFFYEFDLSEACTEGPAFIRVLVDDTSIDSDIFQIKENLLIEETLSDVLNYFKVQRCSDQYNVKDKNCSFYKDSSDQNQLHLKSIDPLDLSGGWYDASGDVSKYLSHLSYANFMNPQQTPLVVWNLMKSRELFSHQNDLAHIKLQERMAYEALHGADFLARMVTQSGAMVMTVFDKWSKELEQREACTYSTQDGIKSDKWQAGLRQGAGMSIAALAKASFMSKSLGIQGDFTSEYYLSQAQIAYDHLKINNNSYLDDGRENIIDQYCGLIASVELTRAGLDYQTDINTWAKKLIERQSQDDQFVGWFRSNEQDTEPRPFFHAADAGLPIITLIEAYPFLTQSTKQIAMECIIKALAFELSISSEVFNPFGLARQYVKDLDKEPRSSFFVPHENESGYWWQGENARLSSLSSSCWLALNFLDAHFDENKYDHQNTLSIQELKVNLNYFARMQIDWILGINPYNMCMLHGHGRNNPQYEKAYPPCVGGICNGITGGFTNELGIDFAPIEAKNQGDQKWRWGEQWIPHAAWYLLAISSHSSYSSSHSSSRNNQ